MPAQGQTQQDRNAQIAGPVLAALAAGGATAASLAPAAAGLSADAAAGSAVAKLSAKAIGELTEQLTGSLMSFARGRLGDSVASVEASLARTFPERTPAELEPLAREEARREVEFQKKMAGRLKQDLPVALSIADRDARRAAVQQILDREQRYVMMREDAMHDRAQARAEMLAVKDASPKGAYWQLSPFVRNHTPDCVALAGKFWPWSVVEAVGPPPRHNGCRCQLLTEDEAVARDLIDPEQADVDPRDALARAKSALKDAELLESSLSPDEWASWVEELYEAAALGGAMIAFYPSASTAKGLASFKEADEPKDQIHLTLVFLTGDASAIASSRDAIRTAVGRAAAAGKPLHGVVGGLGMFSGDPKASERPLVATVDVPGLSEFRADLVRQLGRLMPKETHGFVPHITLRYVPKREGPVSALPPAQLPLDFDRVVLVWGGEKESWPLGRKAAAPKIEEGLAPMRYAKGFEHGGEFMPKLGGDPGRELLRGAKRALARRLAPALPVSGREVARQRRGRMVAMGGRNVFVPEARGFDRTIGGRRFVSPPLSTRVYRDGRLYEPSDMQNRNAGAAGTLDIAHPDMPYLNDAGAPAAAAAQQRVEAALAARDPKLPPVAVGDPHADAGDALDAHGFLEVSHGPSFAGSMSSYLAPDMASRLNVETGRDGNVSKVDWQPATPPAPVRLLSSPPRTWNDFAGDVAATARDIAHRNGRNAHVGAVLAAPAGSLDLSDHAGEHRWNGDVVLGGDVQPSILRAAATRGRGAQLTDGQRREVWQSYQAAAHEAVHAASPIARHDALDPETNAMNEALAEELSHPEAARWLLRQGQDDVAQWRADNPTDESSLGTYTHYRQWLGAALDRARVPPEKREEFLRSLMFDVRPRDRWQALARVSAEANGTRPQDELTRIRGLMKNHDDSAFTPILTPNVEATAGAAEPFRLGAATVRAGDKVHYSKRVLRKGSREWETQTHAGTVERLRRDDDGGSGWTADVRRDDGKSVDRAVLPGQIARLETQAGDDGIAARPLRPFGAAADEVRVGGKKVSAGSKVRWPSGDGTAEGTVSRIVRDRNPHAPGEAGWLIEATTADGGRVHLTPGNTQGKLVAAGRTDEHRRSEGGWGSPADMLLSVEDRTALARHFRLPAGTFAVAAHRLTPARLDTPDAVRQARVSLGDPLGSDKMPPLAVHPTADGRFVVTRGMAALQAGLDGGMGRFPAVLSPVAGVDSRLGKARGAAADGLRRAREILMGGGSAGDVAREGLARTDAHDPSSRFQQGLRAGFHEASGGVQKPGSLFGWLSGEPEEPWMEKQAETWAGSASRAQKSSAATQDDAGIVTLKGSAGGSNGARFGEDAEGSKWLVKDYRGDADRVATELLANSIYGKLGVPVPKAGTLSFGGKAALAYPLIDGTPGGHSLRVTQPNRELAKGFMADAYLANWDVVGLEHDNLLWPEGTTPESLGPDTPATRLDQGGSLQYRAMGQKKPFGPVPTEVWTMAAPRGGQAFGTMAISSETKKNGAAKIASTLDDQTIEGLADGAGFKSKTMRDEVVASLKARRDWMGQYAAGEVHEPKPAEGDEARAALTGGQKGLELFPEQEQALHAFGHGWGGMVNAHLRSGAPKEQTSREVRFVTSQLDSLTRHARTNADVVVHSSLSAAAMPDGGWEGLAGKTLTEPGFLGAAIDRERADMEGAATVRLHLPSGSHALYAHGVPGQDVASLPAQPEVLLARGSRMKVTHVDVAGKRPVVHAVVV